MADNEDPKEAGPSPVPSRNPGSFEDLHLKSRYIFPKTFAGFKLALANKFCTHSQLFSSIIMQPGSHHSLKFSYRLVGDENAADSLYPNFFEMKKRGLIQDLECHHGKGLLSSLSKLRCRINGDALQYFPQCLALNVKKFLAEYAGNRITLGLVARNVLLGDRVSFQDIQIDQRNVTEIEFQSLFNLTDNVAFGIQLRRRMDEDLQQDLNISDQWSVGVGGKCSFNHCFHSSASLTRGVGKFYLSSRLSNDFQVAAGYHYNIHDPDESLARIGCRFTDSRGLMIKLSANTRGQVMGTVAKELPGLALPMTLIVCGKCEARLSTPQYTIGFGLEVP